MKTNRKISISIKIIVMTLALLLLAVSIPAVIVFVSSQKTILDTTQKELEQTANLTQKALISWTEFLKMDIQTMATFKNVQVATKKTFMGKASRKGTQKQFDKKISEFKFYKSLSLANETGDIIVTTNPQLLDSNVADKSFYQAASQAKTGISDLLQNAEDKNIHFFLSTPLFENDTVVGVIFAVVDLGYFEKDFISPIKIGTSGFITMVNSKGLYISHPNRSKVMNDNLNNYSHGKSLITQTNASLEYEHEGQDQISYSIGVPELDWVIIVSAFSDELLAPLTWLTFINGAFSVVILIIGIAASVIFARIIKIPLTKAVDLISQISNGDFNSRIEVKTNDEIKEMSDHMNRLAQQLQSAIQDINSAMAQMASGNLTHEISSDFKGELNVLKSSINESIDLLSKTVSQVVNTSDQVKTGTDEILSAAENLANGNSQQAASLEEISSTLNEIEAQTKLNDENATQAKQVAQSALETVMEGNSRMLNMQQSMGNINDTSNNVSKVIKAIDEIAFQTNLLALNAAVEAARAGKYGKGFAVVADEVRNLAGRSAEAAKSTTELIETSINEVENGVKSSDQMAEILSDITGGVEKIADLIGEIASASGEQKSGIQEVNKGLTLVNNVVQQNSSIAEETSSSAQELSMSANKLQDLVKNFTVKQSPGAPKVTGTKKPIQSAPKKSEKIELKQNLIADTPKKLPELATITQKPAVMEAKPDLQQSKRKTIVLDDDDFGKY